MPIPRSTGNASFAPGAVANFTFAAVTFTAITTGTTVVTQLTVPRSFKIQRVTSVVFATQPQAGLVIGTPFVTGNEPSDPSQNMILNIPITNATTGTLTPTSSKIFVTQD
jgi:hypothetical protein